VRAIDYGSLVLPDAAASRNDRRFAFIVYGDTRGPADGVIRQPQHSDVVDMTIRTIAREDRAEGPKDSTDCGHLLSLCTTGARKISIPTMLCKSIDGSSFHVC